MLGKTPLFNPGGSESEGDLLSVDDLRTLADSGRELARELSLESLLHRILDMASKLTDSPETSIILRNERKPTLYFAAATGAEAEWVLSMFGIHSEKQIPIEKSKAGMVYESGISLVENVVRDHFSGVDAETKKVTKSMVCVPLGIGKERLGVMQVLNKLSGDYSPRDRVILEYFADQASVAIRNAKLLSGLLAHSGLYGSTTTTEELVARMNEINQDARTETLSVIFADMRGFTQFCQSLIDPVKVQQRLSEFISMLSQSILDEDGIVNKFLGDGVMGFFQGERCSERAVKCAFAMVKRFEEIRSRWDDESNQQLDFLDLGIGITTDQVILGGIGNGAVRDYTAIGTAVNLAAAFEASARNGKRILCDRATYRNAEVLVAKVDSPEDFLLKKPGQELGVRYKCYHLESLQPDKKVRVFISHSHEDRKFVEILISDLRSRGVGTWYSVENIRKGALWTAEILKAISQCNWMVVVVSRNSAESKWIRREVELAMAAEHLEDRIIPLVLDDTQASQVSEYLAPFQAIFQSTTDNLPKVLADQVLKNES